MFKKTLGPFDRGANDITEIDPIGFRFERAGAQLGHVEKFWTKRLSRSASSWMVWVSS